MPNAPSNLLVKLSRRLFPEPEEQERFLAALLDPQPLAPCIVWCNGRPVESHFPVRPPAPWQPGFVDRLEPGTRPGAHPLHAEGQYYCLDGSSVFAAAPLVSLTDSSKGQAVYDLCAAPGGKSILSWRTLNPSLLIANEVIGKRIAALVSNFKRCRVNPVVVLHEDLDRLAANLAGTGQVVLVDAPCTGQSLLVKGEEAPGCFHPSTINGSANRQKKILAQTSPLVAPGGFLLYMTCTYSPEENENVASWLVKRFPQFQPVVVPPLGAHQSHLTSMPCYRMWPQEGFGAGAFTVLFQNTASGEVSPIVPEAMATLDVRYQSGVQRE